MRERSGTELVDLVSSREGDLSVILKDHGEGQFLGSSFNLASAAISSSIISLPYTVQNAGLLLGGFLFVAMGLVIMYSLTVLVAAADICNKKTYQDTVKEALGENAAAATGGIIIWAASGSAIVSFIIVADLLSPIFHEDSVLHNRIFIMAISLVVLFPLCYLRRINSLRHASGGAILAFVYLTALIVVSFFVKGTTSNNLAYIGSSGVDVARSIPIILYAYTCHSQAIPVYAELRDNTYKKMFQVICGGVGVSFVLYFTTGIFGYISFGRDVQDNILLNFDPSEWQVMLGRILICAAVILGYPMSTWVIKDSFEQIYSFVQAKRNLYRNFDELPLGRMVSWRQNLLETVVVLGLSITIAIWVPKINVVFGLVGSTCSVLLCFILPGLTYIKLLQKFPPKNPDELSAKIKLGGAKALIGFGILIGILGNVTTITSVFN